MNTVYTDKIIVVVNILIMKDIKMIRNMCKKPLNMVLFVGTKGGRES